MVRVSIIMLAFALAAMLFLYVLTEQEKYLTRAWQIMGAGFVFAVFVWLLIELEVLS